jgi:N-glycosylase/DNA lyase
VVIQIDDDFDLDKIADSGQCFRWEKQGGSSVILNGGNAASYRIISGEDCLYISALGNGCYELDCTEDKYNQFWMDYFDLDENYRDIRDQIDPERDPFLWEAAEHEQGIRILRQDPWEMLITFIISQNRNIPAIRLSVELLAEKCGLRRTDSKGREYYIFPEPAALAELTEKDLSDCSLGYRCKYVHAAAKAVQSGEIDFHLLSEADHAAAVKALTGLFGVGIKVANCVSLFGLHHTDAFPVDVWMKRILAQHYPDGYPYDRYSPYNGIYQQFMFAWYRHAQK